MMWGQEQGHHLHSPTGVRNCQKGLFISHTDADADADPQCEMARSFGGSKKGVEEIVRQPSRGPSPTPQVKVGELKPGTYRSADPPICCINEAARDTLSGNARLSRGKVSVPFGCSFWNQVGAQRRAARHWGAAASKASKASHCLAFAIISWGVC